MNLFENENLYELPNDQNFIHSNDFSTSDLDFQSDQEDRLERKFSPLPIRGIVLLLSCSVF